MTTWIKIYNSMPSHPKVLAAGERAAWLFVCGLCYANEHLTDGFLPRHSLAILAPSVSHSTTRSRLAARLVATGLWQEVAHGWLINDYVEFQRTADEIRDRRRKDRERKRDNSARNPQESALGIRDLDVDVEKSKEEAKASSPEIVRLTHLLAELILANDAKASVAPLSERWQRDMRLLVADRKGDLGEVEGVLRWSQADGFWRSNILSPAKLRKQFTQLTLRAPANRRQNNPETIPERIRELRERLERENALAEQDATTTERGA